jgi:hypothetical protein
MACPAECPRWREEACCAGYWTTSSLTFASPPPTIPSV